MVDDVPNMPMCSHENVVCRKTFPVSGLRDFFGETSEPLDRVLHASGE